MKRLICGWCKKEMHFEVYPKSLLKKKPSDQRACLTCPHCGRLLPSSRKEDVVIGRKKHLHSEWQDGDIVR